MRHEVFDGQARRWYVVKVAHGQELKAMEDLRGQGVSVFCPYRRQVISDKRVKAGARTRRQALMPGYLFVAWCPAAPCADIVAAHAAVQGFFYRGGAPVSLPHRSFMAFVKQCERMARSGSGERGKAFVPKPGDLVRLRDDAFGAGPMRVLRVAPGAAEVRMIMMGSERNVHVGLEKLIRVT